MLPQVINFYLDLLAKQSGRTSNSEVKCHFVNTHFYAKLTGACGDSYDMRGFAHARHRNASHRTTAPHRTAPLRNAPHTHARLHKVWKCACTGL